jgi:thiol-disulfide isomerase/thioredoxin
MGHNRIVTTMLWSTIAYAAMAQHTALTGTIMAPTGDSVALFRPGVEEPLVKAAIDTEGRFKLQFDLDSARALVFSDGSETAHLFMLPGESMDLMLHTSFFDETLRFTGVGAARNNALAGLALAEETVQRAIDQYERVMRSDTLALFHFIDSMTKKVCGVLHDHTASYPELEGVIQARRVGIERTARYRIQDIRYLNRFAALRDSIEGEPIGDIVGEGLQGDTIRLSDFKGRTTVLDFWATWCGPCKADMPHLAELEKRYVDRVNFVSINVWDDREKWKVMSAELGLRHSMFLTKEGMAQLEPYMLRGIPRYMLIDKDMRIISIAAPRPSSPELLKLIEASVN